MRLAENKLQGFLNSPSTPPKIILLFGLNDPLLHYRAELFLTILTAGIKNHFTEIIEAKDLPEILSKSVQQTSLFSATSPSRITIITKITDTNKKYFETMVEAPDHFFILISKSLRSQSSLVKLCDAHASALSVPTYDFTGGDKDSLLSHLSQRHNITLTEPQRTALIRHREDNALDYKNSVEKCFLHLLNPESTTDSLNQMLEGELSVTHDIFDLIIALSENQKDKIHTIYTTLRENGVEDILILRALTAHYNKITLIKSVMAENRSVDFASALRQAKIVLFYKNKAFFEKEVRTWDFEALFDVQKRLSEVEILYKTSPVSFKVRFGRALLQVASKSRSKAA